jgi:ribose-phosphate pyrophosphokinase
MSSSIENLRLLAGNSHPVLAESIAKELKISLIQSKIDRFENLEIHTQIMENIRRRNMVIIQTGVSRPEKNYSINDYVMEILIMADACRRSSVNDITLVIPCFLYARQDKKDVSRAPISARLMADLFETAGIMRVVTLDLHASQIGGMFKIPVDNLYAMNTIASFLTKHLQLLIKSDEYILVSPDAGGIKRMDALAQKLQMSSIIMSKSRDHQQKSVVIKTELIGKRTSVEGKSCIIIDDMCDTGGTIIRTSETLMENGAKDVIVLVIHGILSGPAIDRLNQAKYIKQVIVTNSLPQEQNQKRCEKLIVIDVAPLLAEVIRRLNTGESISDLFN